jgi:hypothetical protein
MGALDKYSFGHTLGAAFASEDGSRRGIATVLTHGTAVIAKVWEVPTLRGCASMTGMPAPSGG